MKSQIATSKTTRGGRRNRTSVFTEHGVIMLASVLNSDRAILVNVAIVRAFVRIRELVDTHKDLAIKLDALEQKYDHQFKVVFDAIRQLMDVGSPVTEKRINGLQQD